MAITIQRQNIKTVRPHRLMTIDPSINNLGMAIWDIPTQALLLWKLVHPKPDCRKNEYEKSVSMCDQLREWAKTYAVTEVLMEVPEHWAVGGFEARETGSIAKLCLVVGLIYSLRDSLEELKIVKPHEWKGQLPKEVMENRLRDDYLAIDVDLSQLNANIVDAIGIGHFYIHGSV